MDFDPFGDSSTLFDVFEENTTNDKQSRTPASEQKRGREAPLPGGISSSVGVGGEDEVGGLKKQKGDDVDYDDLGEEIEPVEVVVSTEQVVVSAPVSNTSDENNTSNNSSNEIGRVTHSVCVPKGVEVTADMKHPQYPPPRPAREYPFTLDPFQKMSIAVLERSESVLVSAHTSAGKTVVAEYAIAMGLRDHQRVIYTSPLKALSNQKFRELNELFGDVGLMTGDVTLNPTASCIVMTTEILRSMLYRGSEIMREVATVVFDEIHYMRDPERGVVWEETIILLPQKVKYVFLSATIPNSEEFAAWIAHTHKQPCHVVYTDIRPVPLQHYVFPSGGAGLHLVVDDKGSFREDNFQKAISGVQGKASGGRAGATKQAGHSDIFKIIQLIMNKNYDPVIVFAFSKRDCEGLAMQMGKLSFTTEDEKTLIREIYANAIDPLSEDDKQLPQIQNILPLLIKGIGIHHSGLLPLIKEVIEILFQEGLLKCLFATETFAMGLNMPAHTAVFSNVRKFDGKDFRWISAGEYVQMSGRAGRRGKDERGIVILMVDEKMEPDVAKGMLKGSTQSLVSAFHITYSMLLNLMRVEGVKPEMLINSSFAAFQSHRKLPELQRNVDDLKKQLQIHVTALNTEAEVRVASCARELVQIRAQLEALRKEFEEIVLHPVYALPYLQAGRMLQVEVSNKLIWGVCVSFTRKGANATRSDYVVDVLLPMEASSKDVEVIEVGSWHVVGVRMSDIKLLSSLRIPLPTDLRPAEARKGIGKKIDTVMQRFSATGLPLLDPLEDMNIRDNPALERVIKSISSLENSLLDDRFKGPHIESLYGHAVEEFRLLGELKVSEQLLKESKHSYMGPVLKRMRRVLRRLQFTTEEDVIDVKGRVACELQASDELLLVEMLFNGVFNDMTPQHIAALLSCFVFDTEKKGQDVSEAIAQLPATLQKDLAVPLKTMQQLARRVATVMLECKIEISPDQYVNKFSPGMANVVFQWSSGAKFSEICKLTSVFEGHIIRCMRRLEELLRQLMLSAKSIGNSPLEQKFSASIVSIKRDIVFSQSLYL